MAQAVSRRPLTVVQFVPGSVHVGFVVDKVTLEHVFCDFFGFLLSLSLHHDFP
jgi:hypothetical protein